MTKEQAKKTLDKIVFKYMDDISEYTCGESDDYAILESNFDKLKDDILGLCFSEVVSPAEPLAIPTARCIEEWFMFPNTIGEEGVFSEEKFWQEAPFRTNGDMIEEIKAAINYFMTTWNNRGTKAKAGSGGTPV